MPDHRNTDIPAFRASQAANQRQIIKTERLRVLKGMLDRAQEMGCQPDVQALRCLYRGVLCGGYDQ